MDEKYANYTESGKGKLGNMKIYLVISWISAAFTAFVSPYFAAVGITFGLLSNKILGRSGNAAIITNIVVAIINFIFWIIMMFLLKDF